MRARLLSLYAPLAVLLVLGLARIHVPGLHFDETNHTSMAIDILNPAQDVIPRFSLPDNALDRSGRFPIVGGSIYNTVITAYLGIPFFETLGYSVFSHRLFELAIAIAIVVLSYRLFTSAGTKAVGFGAVLLLASDPSFVLTFRGNGFLVMVELLALLPTIILGMAAVHGNRSIGRMLLMGMLAGLACTIYFSAFPLVGSLLLFVAIGCWRAGMPLKLAEATWIAIGLLIGLGPELFALASIHAAAPGFLQHGAMPSWASIAPATGHDAAFDSFRRTLRIAWQLLINEQPNLSYGGITLGAWGTAKGIALIAGLAGGIALAIFGRGNRNRPLCALLALMIFSMLAFGFVVSGLRWWHLAPMLPFVYFGSVTAVDALIRWRLRNPLMINGIFASLLLLFTTANITAYFRVLRAIEANDGTITHPVQIGYLTQTLQYQLRDYFAIFISPDLHLQVKFLSGGRVNGRSVQGDLANGVMDRLLANHKKLVFIATSARRAEELITVLSASGHASLQIQHIKKTNGENYAILVLCERKQGYVPLDLPVGSQSNIPFGQKGNKADYRRGGWSINEKWGTWSTDKSARILVSVPVQIEERGACSLRLRARTIVDPRLGTRIITVVVNNEPVGTLEFSSKKPSLSFNLPLRAGLAQAGQTVLVEFVANELLSPSATGDGSDQRKVGIGLMAAWIE